MRPRRDAADNICRAVVTNGGDFASMRPRRDAADNAMHSVVVYPVALASMRPRRDAADNANFLNTQAELMRRLQ